MNYGNISICRTENRREYKTVKKKIVLFLILLVMIAATGCNNTTSDDVCEITEMTSEGVFLPCADGKYIVIFDSYGPVEIYTATGDTSVFDGLTVGDRVSVNYGIILETYPATTEITKIEKISDGTKEDIPEDVVENLEALRRKVWPEEEKDNNTEKTDDGSVSYRYPYVEETPSGDFFTPVETSLSFDYDYDSGVCIIHDNDEVTFTFEAEIQSIIKYSDSAYLLTVCCGRGTGCFMQELYIIEAPQYTPVKVLSYDSIINEIKERVTYKYVKEYEALILDTDSGKHEEIFFSDYLSATDSEFVGVYFGDIVRIEFYEGKPWLYVPGAVRTSECVASFDYTAGITAPIDISDFSIGELNIFTSDARGISNNDIKECLEEEIPFFYCYRDINHDGCKDKIILSAEILPDGYDGSFEEMMQDTPETVNVRMFSGYYFYSGQQSFTECAYFTAVYGAAHCANGQLFITTVDGADYLVETSIYTGQGETNYSYKVFFGDIEHEYIVEEKYVSFEEDNIPDDINEFWNGLDKWINESSVLLVAADIDSDPMVYYSTNDNILNPVIFYNKKR